MKCRTPCPVKINFGEVTILLRALLERSGKASMPMAKRAGMKFLELSNPRTVEWARKGLVNMGFKAERMAHDMLAAAARAQLSHPTHTIGRPGIVEQTVTLGRHLVRLVDTAGIRDTEDVIEKIGVDRSVEAAKDCDAALFVVDDSRPLTDEDRRAMDAALEAPEAIAVLNKQDLGAVIEPSDLPFSYIVPVSCKDGTGFDLLEQAFDMLFPDDAPCDGSLLTNARQADAIVRAKKSVDAALRSLRAGFTPDAVLVDLEAAMRALGEVTGRTMREDITNRIFKRFCVGK